MRRSVPRYSHRDLRIFRSAHRLIMATAASTFALVACAEVLPWAPAAFVALLALGGLGGGALVVSSRLVDAYVHDVTQVRSGRPVSAALRVEVHSRVGLERSSSSISSRSPNARRPGGVASQGSAGLSGPFGGIGAD